LWGLESIARLMLLHERDVIHEKHKIITWNTQASPFQLSLKVSNFRFQIFNSLYKLGKRILKASARTTHPPAMAQPSLHPQLRTQYIALQVHMVQNNFQVLEALLWTYSSEPATYHSPPSMDDPPSYTCHHCRAWFPTEGKHEQHIQLTHPYPCSKYWRVFTTVSLLQLHTFQRHVRKKCPTNVRTFAEFKENPIMVDEEVYNATWGTWKRWAELNT
jgi:hypothetical protein